MLLQYFTVPQNNRIPQLPITVTKDHIHSNVYNNIMIVKLKMALFFGSLVVQLL